MKTNSIFTTADSYKYGHGLLLPDNCVSQYNYMESRGGEFPETVWIGMSFMLQEYLTKVPTLTEIARFRRLATLHGVPFDEDMWTYINKLGYYPIRIMSIPEGSIVPTNMVLATFESTDPKAVGIVGFLETLFMKLWMPTTVATQSLNVRRMLERYGSPEWAQYAYHNFGNRSATVEEHAMLAGFAQLTQFMGTDSFGSLALAEDYYGQPEHRAAGHSVIATEHSITTMNTREGEEEFVYKTILANPDANILSFVGDSYNIYDFVHFCTDKGSRIRELIESRPTQKLVIRPDSGDAIEVISRILNIMKINNLGVVEDWGSILFADFGLLWGDGINYKTMELILGIMLPNGFAAENIVFGSGTNLINSRDRDTQRFAIKCSSITIAKDNMSDGYEGDGYYYEDIDVFKDPITAPGKKSKKGKVTTWLNTETKEYCNGLVGQQPSPHHICALQEVFSNGVIKVAPTLDEIRKRAR